MLTIIDTCYQFDFFSGTEMLANCTVGEHYYFGSSAGKEISESNVQIEDRYSKERIDINVFGNGQGSMWKHLSNFQSPKSGFELDDLINLSEILGVQLVPQPDNILSAESEIIFKNNIPYDIVLLRSISGGRQPEGIIIDKILYVKLDPEMKLKYFNCT